MDQLLLDESAIDAPPPAEAKYLDFYAELIAPKSAKEWAAIMWRLPECQVVTGGKGESPRGE